MNYGPLAQAIEQLLANSRNRPPAKKNKELEEWIARRARCWEAVEEAQDAFYKDVKSGCLKCEDLDQ